MGKMNDLIMHLVNDYNTYSELVALNYAHLKEGKLEDSELQWNRGHLSRIQDYLTQLAEVIDGVSLEWECGVHAFAYGDATRARQLEYRTVHAVFAPEKGA